MIPLKFAELAQMLLDKPWVCLEEGCHGSETGR
jgi:hypothetical protein